MKINLNLRLMLKIALVAMTSNVLIKLILDYESVSLLFICNSAIVTLNGITCLILMEKHKSLFANTHDLSIREKIRIHLYKEVDKSVDKLEIDELNDENINIQSIIVVEKIKTNENETNKED